MTETDLIMPIKFEENNFFILSNNSTEATKAVGAMYNLLYG